MSIARLSMTPCIAITFMIRISASASASSAPVKTDIEESSATPLPRDRVPQRCLYFPVIPPPIRSMTADHEHDCQRDPAMSPQRPSDRTARLAGSEGFRQATALILSSVAPPVFGQMDAPDLAESRDTGKPGAPRLPGYGTGGSTAILAK